MKAVTLNIVFWISVLSSFAQTDVNKESVLKNSVNLNVGTFFIVYGVTFAANYERVLSITKNGHIIGTGVSIEGLVTLDAYPIYVKLFGLFGKKNKKLELALGVGTMLGNPDFRSLTISPLIGYRKHSLKNGSYFRTGIGLTEGIYIGGGFRF